MGEAQVPERSPPGSTPSDAVRSNSAPPTLIGEGSGQRGPKPALAELLKHRQGAHGHRDPEQNPQAQNKTLGHGDQAKV
jgi:hypothetical protein